jgi:hypothetical protein
LPIDLRYLPRAFQMLGTFNPLWVLKALNSIDLF